MKLKFDSELKYQEQAIASIVDLYRGQTPAQSNFTVSSSLRQIGLMENITKDGNSIGIGNKLELDVEDILKNLNEIQLKNGLEQTKSLKPSEYNFDVEMETGTGKTYVYLRTIFELNKNYGFSKFIIVVPSIAIKEGTYKSLNITKDHFKGLYDNTIYEYFIYDSSKLEQVRNFAVSDNIQVMVINIDAFRKSFTDPTKENKANIIHRPHDKLNGMRPIDLIAATNPFVIIDEPQSVDNTARAKEAIKSLNPLSQFRYSATHTTKHNLVYKLDAIDAYEMELVKQIEVASFESKDYHNYAYMKLISVNNKKSPITAKIEIDVSERNTIKRKKVDVKSGTDLFDKSGGREVYYGYIINDIWCEKDNEYVDFTSKSDVLRIGRVYGDIDDLAIKRQQIRKTIEEHLNKELILNKQGVKVLSLFFIDKVANYRLYDEEGNHQKGKYAQIFEEEYKEIIKKPKYNTLFNDINTELLAEEVHGGYFSSDKKGLKDTTGKTNADEDTYSLIMKDKEKLLSFETKLRFIFSHSTLREGWDNPNVFQICTLNETKSEVKKRQEIGRGLRLCVNQDGERLHGFAVNTLTVMANESYEEFAETLQNEIENEEGIKFGIIESHTFANIPVKHLNGALEYLGQKASERLYNHYKNMNYIDSKGKVQDALREALKTHTLELPEEFKPLNVSIEALSKKVSGKLNIKNANEKQKIKLNKQVYLSEDFKILWDKIKYKTTYSVNFDTNELIIKCVEAIQRELNVNSAKLVYSKARVDITVGGVDTTEKDRHSVLATTLEHNLPDIISYLQNKTNLTRKTIVEILKCSDTLHLFKKNPQVYMDEVAKIISSKMRLMIVDGIKYTKIGNDEYYAQELFQDEELFGYLSKNMTKSEKSVYENIIYDSDNEANFVQKFENNDSVKLYVKFPDWFKIPTPLGTYNPDWAVLIEVNGENKLYFVLETKGNIFNEALRLSERAKIDCGHKHFESIGNDVTFKEVDNFANFIEECTA